MFDFDELADRENAHKVKDDLNRTPKVQDYAAYIKTLYREDADFRSKMTRLRVSAISSVTQDGHKLKNLSWDLRSDPDVVLGAVEGTPEAFKYAHEALLADRNFVLEAVQRNGLVLAHVPETFRADRDIIVAAVRQNEMALRLAEPKLRNQ